MTRIKSYVHTYLHKKIALQNEKSGQPILDSKRGTARLLLGLPNLLNYKNVGLKVIIFKLSGIVKNQNQSKSAVEISLLETIKL